MQVRENVTCEVCCSHNSRRRHTKHHLSVLHAATVLALCRGRFLLARSILAQSSVAASQGQDGRKEEEELSGHTGRATKRQRARSPFSRCSHWTWTGERSLPVPTSVYPASYYLRPLPGRWSRARPAALAGKSTMQEGLTGSTEWAILPIQEVAAFPWCTVCEHLHSGNCPEAPGQVGTRRLGAMVSVCRQGRWLLCRRTGQDPRFRSRTLAVGRRRGWELSSLCKSSRPSHGGRPREVASRDATGSLFQHRAKQQESLHSGIHFGSCSVEPLLARSILAQEPAAAILQMSAPAKPWERSGAEPPREGVACAGRPLGTQHGREGCND